MSFEIQRGERICVNICMTDEKAASKNVKKTSRGNSKTARSTSRRRSKSRTMNQTTKNRSKSGQRKGKPSEIQNQTASRTKLQKPQKNKAKSIPNLDCIVPQMSRAGILPAPSHMEPRYEPHTTYKPMVPSEVQNQDSYTVHLTQPLPTAKQVMKPKTNKTRAKASSKNSEECDWISLFNFKFFDFVLK